MAISLARADPGLTHTPDEDLVQRLAAGEDYRAVFGELLRRHGPRMEYQLCQRGRRAGFGHEDFQDALQEALVTLFKAATAYARRAPPQGCLFRTFLDRVFRH